VRVKRSQQQRLQQQGVLRARDDGLRRVRKITWRAGLLAAAAAVIIGARFAHLSPSLPHLPGDLTGGQTSSSGQSGTISSGSSSSSAGVSPASGGGQVTSGGS
jgi:hypothetical protein